jgi:cytochrome b pre-mRNA-processing protein 3
MVMFLKKLWQSGPDKQIAADLYLRVVEKARDPAFYATLGVPDTVDGRFDMIVLHAALVIRRLRDGGARGQAVAQDMFDRMFMDFDRSLRELGVGDMSIGKHIKKMGKAFYGRATAIERGMDTLAVDGGATLREALQDTVFRHRADAPGGPALADYLMRAAVALGEQPVSDVMAGKVILKTLV